MDEKRKCCICGSDGGKNTLSRISADDYCNKCRDIGVDYEILCILDEFRIGFHRYKWLSSRDVREKLLQRHHGWIFSARMPRVVAGLRRMRNEGFVFCLSYGPSRPNLWAVVV